eukprot:CAMPEP_0196656508 /NCGR_PEP_ID=MMETSP1086-20130531/17423_1 /TAXON_ID=77921 /ORGANISM="Cyanoptyche  gloeocystis , Strain SAG4.97" /LENGTH=344 /DNA_ID=CAMNT_0041989279 /DNA_START=125 /DNA_END=1159 /DNA_ORIENTATION=-
MDYVAPEIRAAYTVPFSREVFGKTPIASALETKQWDSRYANPAIPHNASYYTKCLIGGMLGCGLTHTAVTPLDVVKCNMQTNSAKYKSLFSGLSTIMKEEGSAAVWKGWFPTLVGYSAQGMFKFGLNEIFKDTYANLVGEDAAIKYRPVLWAAASGSAEVFADIALCPFEMVKVKVQTSTPGTFPTDFGSALAKMQANSADTRFPFGSLVPLWSRQIPYTIAKFVGFEGVVEMFYKKVFTKPKNEYNKATQLSITFASGYIAGVLCALVSQPADNLVSQLSKQENRGKGFGQIAKEVGMANLFTKGLVARVIMVGTLTGLQWWIYDTWKTAMGLGTSGGSAVKK